MRREIPLNDRKCVQQGRPCHDHCPHIYEDEPSSAQGRCEATDDIAFVGEPSCVVRCSREAGHPGVHQGEARSNGGHFYGHHSWEASSAATVDDLRTALAVSHRSLDKIGEGDWTPQDSAHMRLLTTVEKLLASGGLRTGRIIHGDA